MSTHNLLAGALAVQVALAAFTWWPTGAAPTEPRKLFEGGGNAITAFSVVGSSETAKQVDLAFNGTDWTITSEHGYPADPTKVGEVLEALADLKLRAPIATKKTSHEQFKVGDQGFGKKVTLTANGTPYTFFVGAAQSKSAYLRVDGTDEVYEVAGLSEWALKDAARSYWDGEVVSFQANELSALGITHNGVPLSFSKVDGAWTAANPPEGLIANGAALDALVGKFSTVRLSEPVGKDELPEHGFDAGVYVSWTTTPEGVPTQGGLRVGAEVDGKLYVKADDSSFVVKVPAAKLKDLLTLDPATLFQPAAPEAPPAP